MNDEESLSNLGLALAKTQYKDYSNMAFEEAVNMCPGNTDILANYMLFLLENRQLEKFNAVYKHAERIMDSPELNSLDNLYTEFYTAIHGFPPRHASIAYSNVDADSSQRNTLIGSSSARGNLLPLDSSYGSGGKSPHRESGLKR